MPLRIVILTLAVVLIGAIGALTLESNAQSVELPQPDAPLVMAGGDGVQLAWSLPVKPKADRVIIFRSLVGGANFDEVARVDASKLQYLDDTAALGQTYQYRIQIARGAQTSAMSLPGVITVGDSARISFLGGSTDRALFEVVMFRRGRRISAQFVHKLGDQIGDLAYVPELDSVEDFRLGPKLTKIALDTAETRETVSEELKGPDGEVMKDLAGRPIKVEYEFPGATHEVAIATLQHAKGNFFQLKEGETYKVD